MQQAEADKKAQRYNEAYDAYQQVGELVGPLEQEITQWQANEQARAEADELRGRIASIRDQAQQAEAQHRPRSSPHC